MLVGLVSIHGYDLSGLPGKQSVRSPFSGVTA